MYFVHKSNKNATILILVKRLYIGLEIFCLVSVSRHGFIDRGLGESSYIASILLLEVYFDTICIKYL